MASTADTAHHEPQKRLRCALHAVNALLPSAPYFSASDFDAFAADIVAREAALGIGSFFLSSHSTPFLGQWSLEVILAALQSRSLTAAHFPSGADGAPDRVGYLLNRASTGIASMLFGGRHWVALRKVNAEWLNFDSNLSAPSSIGTDAEVLALLSKEPASTHVLCVSTHSGNDAQ
jgi:hypothetical protein